MFHTGSGAARHCTVQHPAPCGAVPCHAALHGYGVKKPSAADAGDWTSYTGRRRYMKPATLSELGSVKRPSTV